MKNSHEDYGDDFLHAYGEKEAIIQEFKKLGIFESDANFGAFADGMFSYTIEFGPENDKMCSMDFIYENMDVLLPEMPINDLINLRGLVYFSQEIYLSKKDFATGQHLEWERIARKVFNINNITPPKSE